MKYRWALVVIKERLSRPARGAWIEILCVPISCAITAVAPRTGRVD